MADAVTSQTIIDGAKNVVQKFTNISDGTGESAVVKIDVSALASNSASGLPCTGVKLGKIVYSTFGMSAKRSVERTNRQFVMTMSLCYETDKEHEYKICHFVGTHIKRGRNGVKPEYAEIFTDLTDDLSGVEERMAEWGQHMDFEFKHPQAKKFIKRKKKTGEKKK